MKKLRTSIYVLVLSLLLAVGANAQSNLLVAGDFESINSLTTYWPATTGVWGTESSVLSGAGNGVTPFGSQMLRLNHAGGGTQSQTAQIVEGPFPAGSVVTLTAKFNTWLTGQNVRLDIQTNAGLALTGTRYSSPTLALDSDASTWQTVTATTTLTGNVNYISAEIFLSQNSNGALYGQARAYVDEVVLTVVSPLPTQTLTILGGSGNVGDVAEYVEYYNPATGNWQPAYLTGSHPWGFVTGTNSWINYKTNTASDPGAGPTTNQTLWYQYRVRFTVPSDAVNPQMTFSVKADNFLQVAINGVTAGGSQQFINNTYMDNVIVGAADQVNVDAVFSQNVHPGENTITLNVGDWGGLNGFNFRIDLSMQSSEPLEIVPPEPADITPPVITAPANITVEATSADGAVVTFTATAEDDVDGPVPVVATSASGSTFPIGTTTVGVTATDEAGNSSSGSFTITVEDTKAPEIASVTPSSATLWPPNHKMVSITVTAVASDIVGVTSLKIVSVTSNEPDNGLGDGDTAGDIEITGDLTVNLRAERSGKGSGRTYTITVEARDAAGNASTATTTVTVPRDKGKNTSASPASPDSEYKVVMANPTEYALANAYPNPFNPTTSITYELPEPTSVRLSVFDMLGREVAVLVDGEKSAGRHSVRFNAEGLTSGIYIYRIHAGTFTQTKKFTLMK